MNVVFADTFYWAALTSTNDSSHRRALQLSRNLQPDRVMTTEEVLVEYLAFFSNADPNIRQRAGTLVSSLFSSPGVEVWPQSHDSFVTGLELYRARPDKGYSLTDCISMQAMRREGVTDVLTNDHHFAQEGFNVLFRR